MTIPRSSPLTAIPSASRSSTKCVERLARQLAGAGVQPGDTVALSLVNGPEIVLAFLAIVAAGAAAAPLNPGYTAAEFRTYLEDLRPRAMLFHGDDRRSGERRVLPSSASRSSTCLRGLLASSPSVGGRHRSRSPIPTRWRCSCTRAAPRASRRSCRYGSATSPTRRVRSPRTTRSRRTTSASASCRSSTSTACSRRRSPRSTPAARSSRRRASVHGRSGTTPSVTGRPGTRPCRRSTTCWSVAPRRRRHPRTPCALRAPAPPPFPRRSRRRSRSASGSRRSRRTE